MNFTLFLCGDVMTGRGKEAGDVAVASLHWGLNWG